jgi:saccharopine dehydrogenase (NADP+, L-glutamate forming)
MKKVLILGAGMVVKPIVNYLLSNEFVVTVASRTKSKADAMIHGHKNGRSVGWVVDDQEMLDKMIQEHDLIVSLLPYAHHVMVAGKCIKYRKNMVTTSYVKPEMKALDEHARNAGIIILNELGLDPGIDHMSAMRIIDTVHSKGGKILEFYSLCGALPAPEACDNPFNYKFSWSPKGVVMASNNDGRFLRHGKEFYVQPVDLFKNPFKVDFPEVGLLEVYPNRDSLPYIELYKIPETKTMFRGTFRHAGWCKSLDAMKRMGLINNDKMDFSGMTYADFMAKMIDSGNSDNIKQKVSDYLQLPENSTAINAMEWLGFFSNSFMERQVDTPFEITSDIMIEKMKLSPNERDMVVMQHTFLAGYPDGSKEVIKSRMLDFGTPATDTAVSRTVALPAAVGVEMILQEKIDAKGVHIPVIPEIYNPILDRLENMNIKMIEDYGLPESDNIR